MEVCEKPQITCKHKEKKVSTLRILHLIDIRKLRIGILSQCKSYKVGYYIFWRSFYCISIKKKSYITRFLYKL